MCERRLAGDLEGDADARRIEAEVLHRRRVLVDDVCRPRATRASRRACRPSRASALNGFGRHDLPVRAGSSSASSSSPDADWTSISSILLASTVKTLSFFVCRSVRSASTRRSRCTRRARAPATSRMRNDDVPPRIRVSPLPLPPPHADAVGEQQRRDDQRSSSQNDALALICGQRDAAIVPDPSAGSRSGFPAARASWPCSGRDRGCPGCRARRSTRSRCRRRRRRASPASARRRRRRRGASAPAPRRPPRSTRPGLVALVRDPAPACRSRTAP